MLVQGFLFYRKEGIPSGCLQYDKLSKEEAVASLVKISRRNYAFRFIYPLILLVFGIVILILSLQNSDQYLSGSVFIVLAGLIAAYNAYCMIRLPHQVVKKNKELAEYGMVNEFTLKEESFSLVSKIGDQVSKYTAEYQQLKKIVEEDDVLLFMVSSTDVFIAKKDGFQTKKELDIFLYGLSKHQIKVKKRKSKSASKEF